jgi:hypothetical protein
MRMGEPEYASQRHTCRSFLSELMGVEDPRARLWHANRAPEDGQRGSPQAHRGGGERHDFALTRGAVCGCEPRHPVEPTAPPSASACGRQSANTESRISRTGTRQRASESTSRASSPSRAAKASSTSWRLTDSSARSSCCAAMSTPPSVSCSSSSSDSRSWWRACCISLPYTAKGRLVDSLLRTVLDDLPSSVIVLVADAHIRDCHPRPCGSHASLNAARRTQIAADRPPVDRRRLRADGARLTFT